MGDSRKERGAPISSWRKELGLSTTIRVFRKKRGFKFPRSLAKASKVCQRTVRDLEIGKTIPNDATLRKILAALQLTRVEENLVWKLVKFERARRLLGPYQGMNILDAQIKSQEQITQLTEEITKSVMESISQHLIYLEFYSKEGISAVQEDIENAIRSSLLVKLPKKTVPIGKMR